MAFESVEAVLLLGPPLAYWFYLLSSSLSRQSYLETLAGTGMAFILILGLGTIGLRFASQVINLASLGVCYVIYCFFAACSLRIEGKLTRIAAVTLMYTPIALGYLMASIGTLALGFIVGDFVASPSRTEVVAPDLDCEVTGWGIAMGPSGYTVDLYRTWSYLPMLRRHVHSLLVTESPPGNGIQGATCSDALAAYRRQT